MSSPGLHPNVEMLRAIYADLRRIAEHADDDIVLHTADRELPRRTARVAGKGAVLAKELDLIGLTGNTLHMDVQQIIADEHFGAVLGILRAQLADRDVEMPFCGLWRFRNGKIVEHWENAYDAAALSRLLMSQAKHVVS